MSGRYAFSSPGFRSRDGWFRLGSLDVTTTALVVGLALVSMVLFAADPAILDGGVFETSLVREGEVWRLVLWPLVNPPTSIFVLLGLAVFWFLGHAVEDEIGRVPYTWLLLAMTVLPAAAITALGIVNDPTDARWSTATYGVSLLSLALIVIFGVDKPEARFFFGIPAWVFAAAYVAIEVLSDVGLRAWARLVLVLLVIAVGCIGARQRGMLEVATFIPRFPALAGRGRSPYGDPPSSRRRTSGGGGGRSRGRSKAKGRGRGKGQVVEGPWSSPPTPGLTPLEQAELDVLLDKVSDGGVASLSGTEQSRLQALSQRLRER